MRGVSRDGVRVARGARKIGLALVCAGLLASGVQTRAFATTGDATTKDATQGAPTDAKTKTPPKGAKKPKKKKKPAHAPVDGADAPTAKRRKIGAPPAYVVGDADAHLINQDAPPLVPFAGEASAVKKAFAETRREQLVDAEKAARDEKSPDRWRTVLFMIRGMPERIDPEACFWRVLSFYRLGELARARTVREGCDLPAKDSVALNAEDATAAGIPEMGANGEEDPLLGAVPVPGGANAKAADKPAAPTVSPATLRYTGPSPQRFQ
jgi:hypothetical protein